eukprot:Clim_evm38s227 gene=Clim_evmTU38s227
MLSLRIAARSAGVLRQSRYQALYSTAVKAMAFRSYSSDVKPSVGFLGLGNMGANMCKNLAKAGYPVVVFDVVDEAATKLKNEIEGSCEVADSPEAVAAKASTVISMLPAGAHVKEAFMGDNGMFKSAKEGHFFIDASTIQPDDARELAAECKERGMSFCDAPVSGGVVGAANGTLTFMVGADDQSFDSAKDILQHMGKAVTHCGQVGNGQVVKICNNMLLAIHMIGVAEAFNLGVKQGVDAKLLASIINTSTGNCWSSNTNNPVPGVIEGAPAGNNYEGGFGTALMQKDLGLAVNAAAQAKAPVFLGGFAHQMYTALAGMGLGKKDFGVIYDHLKNMKSW